MNEKLFGTDGVRGRANHELSVELAVALGRAVGTLFHLEGIAKEKNLERRRIVVGKDTRLSCYIFENALIAGLCSMGIDTLMLGPFPTPGIAFITRAYRADAGVMISASHNPYYDNGIKFFSSEGYKFSDEWEAKVEKLVRENHYSEFLPDDDQLGKNMRVTEADGRYIEFCKGTFPRKGNLAGLKIVLDCANGATHRVAPHVFRELGAELFLIGCEPNGLNINLRCGSLHPEEVQKSVLEKRADVGIALDGDGDRVIMVDEKGQLIDGDAILAICARDLYQKGQLDNQKVVGTVMTNYGVVRSLEKLGIDVVQAQVGDRYVIEEMRDKKIVLGGEQSGHVIFHEFNTTGDGIVAALQVLNIMMESGLPLSELAAFIIKYPQVLINVPVVSKPDLNELPLVKEAIRKVEDVLEGRILVRYSGTESICRVLVEGAHSKEVREGAKSIAKAVKDSIGRA